MTWSFIVTLVGYYKFTLMDMFDSTIIYSPHVYIGVRSVIVVVVVLKHDDVSMTLSQ